MNEHKQLITVENLKKYFPASHSSFFKSSSVVKAVDGIDFSISSGETLALVGESGCGKTTTARLALRLDYPTHGRITVNGVDIHTIKGSALREYRKKVQAVFQDPWSSLNPRIRVRDLIAESLIINEKLSKKEITKHVEKVLDEVGLRPEYARNFPHEFSGGQRQRIAIASALISRPQIIILDEPVSALDVSIRSQIMNLLKELQTQYGVSYLLVAHDLGTTRFMADDIVVMYLGKIVEHAKTEELFNNHRHPYTRALFSAALPSHPDDHSSEVLLQGEIPSPLNPPSGCLFHTRCNVKLGRRCETEIPILQSVGDQDANHVAACHRLDND